MDSTSQHALPVQQQSIIHTYKPVFCLRHQHGTQIASGVIGSSKLQCKDVGGSLKWENVLFSSPDKSLNLGSDESELKVGFAHSETELYKANRTLSRDPPLSSSAVPESSIAAIKGLVC